MIQQLKCYSCQSPNITIDYDKRMFSCDCGFVGRYEPCNHKWVYIDSKKTTKKVEGYEINVIQYTKIYRYYCEHCLELGEKIKEEISKTEPIWY